MLAILLSKTNFQSVFSHRGDFQIARPFARQGVTRQPSALPSLPGRIGIPACQASGTTGIPACHASGRIGIPACQSSGRIGIPTCQVSGTTGIPACQASGRIGIPACHFITPTKVGVHSGSAFSRQVKDYSEALSLIIPSEDGIQSSSSSSSFSSSSSSIIQIELKDNLQNQAERFTQTWAEVAGKNNSNKLYERNN